MPTSQLEIEFKNLLTKKEFHDLCHQLHVSENLFELQRNYYLDTNDQTLKTMNTALRLRIRKNIAQIMLKIATEDIHEHIEINETLDFPVETPEDIASWIDQIPDAFKDILATNDIPLSELRLIAKIATFRAEIPYDKGRLFLDFNRYGKEDYELELEYPDHDEGVVVFNNFLIQHNIDRRVAKPKIARATEFNTTQARGDVS